MTEGHALAGLAGESAGPVAWGEVGMARLEEEREVGWVWMG